MKNLKINYFLAVILVTVVGLGCKKEGPPGPAGKDGNANVVSSTVTVSNWTYNSPSWEGLISYGAITQEIIDRGAVLVYVNTGNSWLQLPATFYQSASYSSTILVANFTGGVAITFTDSDLVQPANPGPLTFKIVVIAPSQRIANPDLDYTNYEEVKNRFHLND